MKRIFLTLAALIALFKSYGQINSADTGFASRKLKIEEINLVSSYYHQNGDHAAVTGGIGSERLTDISNSIDVKLIKYDRHFRKHSFLLDLGIDHYTSASSDMIDLAANSSASHADTRIYPSFNWTVENLNKGMTFGLGASYSKEFDYKSYGFNAMFSKKTANKMGEFTAKVQVYLDRVKIVVPIELFFDYYSLGSGFKFNGYHFSSRNSYSASLSYSQIINDRFQVAFLADVIQQHGYLGLPFHRVYFQDSTVHREKLPSNRFKLPLGIRGSYFVGDQIIIRGYYRFYVDNWGLIAHTADIEVPVKISPYFSVSPFYRFYTQSAVKYFAPYRQHTSQDSYYTSNYDLSKFSSNFLGAGIHLTPPNGILGIREFNTLELRYGHYMKTTGMNANILSLSIKIR